MAKLSTTTRALGLSLPIKIGDSGFFEQNYDTFSQIRSNIVNLIKTVPGERRMQPTFGCRLHTMVFEQNIDSLPSILENIIREDVSNWISGIGVESVDVSIIKNDESLKDVDIYKLSVIVRFKVILTNQTDAVEVVINKGMI